MKWTGSIPVYHCAKTKSTGEVTSYFVTSEKKRADYESKGYEITTYSYGQDIGFIYADFIYTGKELVGNMGSSITSAVLDPIKNALGNFEYFYDLEGNFIFREKKNYLNTSMSSTILELLKQGSYSTYLIDPSKGTTVYDFTNTELISSYNNNPDYASIKNDFLVWGIRKSATGMQLPIRYHLAIDEKPPLGKTIWEVYKYTDPSDNLIKAKVPLKVTSEPTLDNARPGVLYSYNGSIYKVEKGTVVKTKLPITKIMATDWRTELYLQGVAAEYTGTDSNYYYTELVTEWPKIYDIWGGGVTFTSKDLQDIFHFDKATADSYASKNIVGAKAGFLSNKIADGDYFLDFIDSDSALGVFSIKNIGRRTEVTNDNKVNCIIEPDIPDLIIIENNQPDTAEKLKEAQEKEQKYVLVPSNIFSSISTGGTKNSAYNAIRDLLYQHTQYNESISIQCMPIYHLDVNTRVAVNDSKSNIYGEYVINKITIPLDLGGQMSISATKAVERI